MYFENAVSSFYTTDEKMETDEVNQSGQIKKRPSFTGERVVVLKTDIQGKIHQWTERIQINHPNEMRTTYIQDFNGVNGESGLFVRLNCHAYALVKK